MIWSRRDIRRSAVGPVVSGLSVVVAVLAALLALPAVASAASDKNRYSLVHGCFALQDATTGNFVQKSGGSYAATAGSAGAAEGFRMQATDLGRYLFFDGDKEFLALAGSGVSADSDPSDASDLTVDKTGDTFTVSNGFNGNSLGVAGNGNLTNGSAAAFNFVKTSGCSNYPEVTTNVEGDPSKRFPRYREARGMTEGHMHHMAFRFLGGAHCGRPWHRFGVTHALRDCLDHEADGCAAVLDTFLGGDPCHDPVGWPDFKDWPHPKSLTHEQSYYKWLERAHQSGLRVFVNLMVQNRVLCEIYPVNPEMQECDDTKTVDIQIKEAYNLQAYVDAQEGGPGKGWYRIVKNPFQARKVINSGKLAVVLGQEVSEPFTCRMFNGVPTCNQADITREIQHLYDQGVRQMEITNKFDNALTGVAGDNGETGTLVNSGNFYATGRYWDLEQCQGPEGEHDKSPTGVEHNDDTIAGRVIEEFFPAGVLPVYPEPPLCNTLGLTELGEHAIKELIKKGMIFDPDHMSVKGRDAAMNLLEAKKYSGVISSHSWSTPGTLSRIFRLGGIVTPYAGGSTGFIDKWLEAKEAYEGRQFFGIGWGADQNGFGGQGGPRGTDVPDPVTYPFKSFDGKQTINAQQSGNREYDINADGVAHYGLYPDWVEDLRQQAGNEIIRDLGKGAESYLQMWERANGVKGLRCPVWKGQFHRKGLGVSLRIEKGAKSTLYRSGQPVSRNRVWRWCTRFKKDDGRQLSKKRQVDGVFDTKGTLRVALSTLARHTAGGIGRGDSERKLRRKAKPIGRGVWVEKGSRNRDVFVYGTKGGRVRVAGVASNKIAGSDKALRNYLSRADLH